MDKNSSSKRQARCKTQTIRTFDADFESYWLEESRNKNRNRIRVGRQYQATVPPLLKPGETDGRKCEDLETLKWKPDYEISEEQLDHYLSVAKAVSLFAKAINVYQKADTPRCLQSALRGLSEFVSSHHPCHHDDGCKLPNDNSTFPNVVDNSSSQLSSWSSLEEKSEGAASSSNVLGRCEWTPQEADLFAKALEVCGKNFGAIKKEFLPWKPVKSIIEFYYCGKGEKEEEASGASTNQSGASTSTSCNRLLPVKDMVVAASNMADNGTNNPPTPKKEKDKKLFESANPEFEDKISLSHISKLAEAVFKAETSDICGKMVPPPLLHNGSPNNSGRELIGTDEQAASTLGSLKFYLGGQLVLKLNAQQDSPSSIAASCPEASKCQWVQSKDTPKLLPQKTLRNNSNKLEKHRKKVKTIKKELPDGAVTVSEPANLASPSTSSPSDRDGTDSERSHTPDSFAKRAKVKLCYPNSGSSASSCCSTTTRLSPKPPWTPPVEFLKWDKSPDELRASPVSRTSPIESLFSPKHKPPSASSNKIENEFSRNYRGKNPMQKDAVVNKAWGNSSIMSHIHNETNSFLKPEDAPLDLSRKSSSSQDSPRKSVSPAELGSDRPMHLLDLSLSPKMPSSSRSSPVLNFPKSSNSEEKFLKRELNLNGKNSSVQKEDKTGRKKSKNITNADSKCPH